MLDDARRLDVLAALGIDVYRLRAADPVPSQPPSSAGAGNARAGSADLPVRMVIACAETARRDARLARRLGQVVRALGVDEAAVAWVEGAADGSFAALPPADTYLMFGGEAARHGAALLPIDRQNSATIAVTPDPAEMMRDGAARRALWQTLKPLARRLRQV